MALEPDLVDIFCGTRVQELRNQGWFGRDSDDIGLVLSTDGGVLFKRTSINAWPVWGVIANLPPEVRLVCNTTAQQRPPLTKCRFKEEHMILIGLWVGRVKPPMNAFLRPLAMQLRQLEKGVRLHDSTREFNARVCALTFTMDLKSKVLTIVLWVLYSLTLYSKMCKSLVDQPRCTVAPYAFTNKNTTEMVDITFTVTPLTNLTSYAIEKIRYLRPYT